LKVHLHHSSEIKGHKEVTKQQKFFLLSAWWFKDPDTDPYEPYVFGPSGSWSGSVQIMRDPVPGGPKTYRSYGSGSTTLNFTYK
jgi:hypothetical protein